MYQTKHKRKRIEKPKTERKRENAVQNTDDGLQYEKNQALIGVEPPIL
jgi:hypothetical protein